MRYPAARFGWPCSGIAVTASKCSATERMPDTACPDDMSPQLDAAGLAAVESPEHSLLMAFRH